MELVLLFEEKTKQTYTQKYKWRSKKFNGKQYNIERRLLKFTLIALSSTEFKETFAQCRHFRLILRSLCASLG